MSELAWALYPLTNKIGFYAAYSSRTMAPKRRAASASKAGGKKVKEEPETPKPKDAFTSAKEALLAAGPQIKGKKKVDEYCPLSSSAEVG